MSCFQHDLRPGLAVQYTAERTVPQRALDVHCNMHAISKQQQDHSESARFFPFSDSIFFTFPVVSCRHTLQACCLTCNAHAAACPGERQRACLLFASIRRRIPLKRKRIRIRTRSTMDGKQMRVMDAGYLMQQSQGTAPISI